MASCGESQKPVPRKIPSDDFFKNEVVFPSPKPEEVLASTPKSVKTAQNVWSEVNDASLGLSDPLPPPAPVSSETLYSEPEQSDSGVSLHFDSSSELSSDFKTPSPPSKTAPKRPLTISGMPWLSEKPPPIKKLKVEEKKEPVCSSDAFDFVKAVMKQRGGENF